MFFDHTPDIGVLEKKKGYVAEIMNEKHTRARYQITRNDLHS
jgi:hypothetical protein